MEQILQAEMETAENLRHIKFLQASNWKF